MAKKWTKKAIGTMTGILDGVWLQERMYHPAEKIRGAIESQRLRLVMSGLEAHVRISTERAKEHQDTANHARTSGIWGASTEEMFQRFVGYARDEQKATEKLRILLARVEAEGLPPEVETYLPQALRG